MYSSDELFQRSREGYFGVYFPSCEAKREMNAKITLEWAQKQFVTRVYASFYFLHDIANPEITIKTTIFTHRPRDSLARFSFCWWRHNRLLMTLQWPDNCDAITWIMISNSFDIGFINDDIHGRSCKKGHIRAILRVWWNYINTNIGYLDIHGLTIPMLQQWSSQSGIT